MPTITPSLDPEDEPPMSEAELATAAALMFQGAPIWPLTKSSELLHKRVTTGTDLCAEVAQIFVFIHLKRGAKDFYEDFLVVTRLADDRARFRVEVAKYFDALPMSATEEAYDLWSTVFGYARRTEVQASPAGGRTKVVGAKKKVTTRQTSSGKPSRSRRR
jgi:hypothetical protein